MGAPKWKAGTPKGPRAYAAAMPKRLRLAHLSLLVREYDEAIAFYVNKLGFTLEEDTDLGNAKRWVRISPGAGSASCCWRER